MHSGAWKYVIIIHDILSDEQGFVVGKSPPVDVLHFLLTGGSRRRRHAIPILPPISPGHWFSTGESQKEIHNSVKVNTSPDF
jgi:hypothetical protein